MKVISIIIISLMLVLSGANSSEAARLKDIVSFEGVRQNQLIGYGLVIGLNGTGDRVRNSPFTQNSMMAMLDRMGVGLSDTAINSRNVAAVIVTANLPPFARKGSTIDANVSSLGDATSLQGGTLLITQLLGSDGQTYATAQGAVTVGGFSVSGQAGSITTGVPTSGRLTNGATIEREIDFDFREMNEVKLALANPDFTTASRIAAGINQEMRTNIAEMMDSGTVNVVVPDNFPGGMPALIARIENIEVDPDTRARVVIDSKSGTIVIGKNVRIDKVAVSQGGLTIRIEERPEASDLEPFTLADQLLLERTTINVDEKEASFATVGGDVTLEDLVNGLNQIGVTARETIAILEAIKAAGALHADLEIM